MNEPKGYWSSVFFQATMLMRQKPQIGGETAFWMARSIVDQNLFGSGGHGDSVLPFRAEKQSEALVLAP